MMYNLEGENSSFANALLRRIVHEMCRDCQPASEGNVAYSSNMRLSCMPDKNRCFHEL